MAGGDQAAGLRRWAEQFGPVDDGQVSMAEEAPVERAVEPVTLLVIGVPGSPSSRVRRVQATLARWQANGHRWVGDLARWKVVALDADSPHLAVLASQQSRWGVWVDGDADGFRRVYRTLRCLREQGGPQRLLVLHAGIASHGGLLRNLQQAAAGFLDTELLLLPEQPDGLC